MVKSSAFKAVFDKKKDSFVEKYQILLNHVQREREVVKSAEKARVRYLDRQKD